MFYHSPRFVLFGFFLLCAWSEKVLGGDLTKYPRYMDKPFSPSSKPQNSTFHWDQPVTQSRQKVAKSVEELQNEKVAKSLTARWLKTYVRELSAQPPQATTAIPANANANDPSATQPPDNLAFQWKPAFAQAMRFLWIEHTFRFLTEPGTRAELRGPFFKDWINSVRSTRGWRDGDPFLVNYIGHPMQGSVTNYIFVHNDPRSLKLEAGFNKAYFKSRLKAMLFSTLYSTQFELGPLGEASLGNVGLKPSERSRHPSALVDLIVTPTLGTVWMMGEDVLDRVVVKRLEDHVTNRFVRLMVRGVLNPSKSFANILRGRYPWHRDGRSL